MRLRWFNTYKNYFIADLNEGENVGYFIVKRAERRRKDPWQAIFKGAMRTGPNSISRERQQNFIATEAEAKAICESWLAGKTAGEMLAGINAKRARGET